METKPIEYVVFLGPEGATFSHMAYDLLANEFKAPRTKAHPREACMMPAAKNADIPSAVAGHRGYGAIAMETLAEARVAESLEGFIRLLQKYDHLELPGHNTGCPIHVLGAVEMELNFCLMVNPRAYLDDVRKVLAHPKAAGACKKRLFNRFEIIDMPSNGEGARLLAEDSRYINYAALGPRSAAEKYSLRVMEDKYEDERAVTTFFLLGPRMRKVSIGDKNRVLIVFRLPHEPGSLVRALQPFASLNMMQIHSVHTGNHSYDFAIELELNYGELPAFHKAHAEFAEKVTKQLTFGPFEVIAR